MFHPTLSKKGRWFWAPIIKFFEYVGKNHPALMVQLRYFAVYKRLANLKHPKDLNEKILYTKLYTDTSKWTNLVDKYKVREYIHEKSLDDTLVKLYGVWYTAEEFLRDYDSLPNSFILKANNGEGKGTNQLVKDKEKANKRELYSLVVTWLARKNIGALVAEPQYEGIVPCVIAEELLPLDEGHHSLTDYKIWCFDGTPTFIWVCNDRNEDGNSAQGGISVKVDTETGKVAETATAEHGGGILSCHPDTNKAFGDIVIENWDKLKEEIESIGTKLIDFKNIALDIAVTEEGAKLLEFNFRYGIEHQQCVLGGVRRLLGIYPD